MTSIAQRSFARSSLQEWALIFSALDFTLLLVLSFLISANVLYCLDHLILLGKRASFFNDKMLACSSIITVFPFRTTDA